MRKSCNCPKCGSVITPSLWILNPHCPNCGAWWRIPRRFGFGAALIVFALAILIYALSR
jgi:hypothetical protein